MTRPDRGERSLVRGLLRVLGVALLLPLPYVVLSWDVSHLDQQFGVIVRVDESAVHLLARRAGLIEGGRHALYDDSLAPLARSLPSVFRLWLWLSAAIFAAGASWRLRGWMRHPGSSRS